MRISRKVCSVAYLCCRYAITQNTTPQTSAVRGVMQNPEMKKEQLIQNMYDHCLGSGDPTQDLIGLGVIDDDWISRYLRMLELASDLWENEEMVPKKVVASVHYSSSYLSIRYEVWRQENGKNNMKTEKLLAEIRTPSEVFLLRAINA